MTADERRAALEPLMTAVEDLAEKPIHIHDLKAVEQAAVAFAIALYERVGCPWGAVTEGGCDGDGCLSSVCRELQAWRSIAEEMRR